MEGKERNGVMKIRERRNRAKQKRTNKQTNKTKPHIHTYIHRQHAPYEFGFGDPNFKLGMTKAPPPFNFKSYSADNLYRPEQTGVQMCNK